MKIALFGASGMIGQRIAQEALSRGHTVTAIMRNPQQFQLHHQNLTVVVGDVQDVDSISHIIAGHDIVVNATGPKQGESSDTYSKVAHALIQSIQQTNVPRLIVVGGAGSLEIAPGVQLVDTPSFPAAWKDGALAHRDALAIYRTAPIAWTYFSPAALIQPGQRTGKYRTATEQLVTDAQGNSQISAEDYAVALLDEIEHPQFIRQRFTAAY